MKRQFSVPHSQQKCDVNNKLFEGVKYTIDRIHCNNCVTRMKFLAWTSEMPRMIIVKVLNKDRTATQLSVIITKTNNTRCKT